MRIFIILIIVVVILIAGTLVFLRGDYFVPKEQKEAVSWKEDFAHKQGKGVPSGWKLKGKPGTPKAEFSVEKDPKSDTNFLHVEADKASASIITDAKGVDLEKTPILKWKWRADKLPPGGDGRESKTDDQAIGVYVGSGGMLNSKSISYRWDTDTPKGSEGNVTYGGGIAKIKWYTLRNKDDSLGKWIVEERNVAEDFKKAWGYTPKDVYVSVCSNSQYTGTEASADLGWIEFVSQEKN